MIIDQKKCNAMQESMQTMNVRKAEEEEKPKNTL